MPKRSEDGHRSVDRAILVSLVVIIVVAAVLRTWRLTDDVAWLDEVLSISFSSGSARDILNRLEPQHLPLFFEVNAFFLNDQVAEIWMRLWMVVLGIALVPLGYLVAVGVGGPKLGLTTAAILALSQFQITYAREIRMYGLVAFLALLGTWAVLRLERDQGGRSSWAILLLASALNLYTSAFALLIVALHWGTVSLIAWRVRPLRRGLILMGMLLLALYVPALRHIMPLFDGTASLLSDNLGDYEHFVPLVVITLRHFAGMVPALAVILGLASVAGAVLAWRRQPILYLVTFGSFILPLFALYLAEPGHTFNPRYVVYAQAHLVLLSAWALVRLWDRWIKPRFRLTPEWEVTAPALLAVALVVTATQLTPRHELIGRHADLISLADALRTEIQPGDWIGIRPEYENNSILYHLDQVSRPGERLQIARGSSNSWYQMFHREPRRSALPADYGGPAITVVGFDNLEALGSLPEVEGAIWLVTHYLPPIYESEFQPVLKLSPVLPFSENNPQGDARYTFGLYRRAARISCTAPAGSN